MITLTGLAITSATESQCRNGIGLGRERQGLLGFSTGTVAKSDFFLSLARGGVANVSHTSRAYQKFTQNSKS